MSSVATHNTTKYEMLRVLLVVLVAMFGALSISAPAHADGDDDAINNVIYIGENNATAGAIATQINNKTDNTILSYSPETGVFTFDNTTYAVMQVTDKQEFMSDALGYIKQSSLPTKEKNKIYNFVADQDGTTSSAIRNLKVDSQADLATAASWYKPFSGIISTILGVLALAVFIFLGIGVVVDIAYMVIPPFRILISKEDDKKPFMVSHEAYTSTREAEDNANTGKYSSYMGLYLRRRIGVLILISLALLYLISGQIFDIIAFIVDAFDPLTRQITNTN